MYPNLYYAIRDIFGLDWKFLRVINSFGFFMAISFVCAAIVLSRELKRKERLGQLQAIDEQIMVGKPATPGDLLLNFLLGFILGFKIIGLFFANAPLAADPRAFILSSEGNWPAGIISGLLFAVVKWYEKNKQKLAEPAQRNIRIWPHDRVGDLAMLAAIFGFAGAKIFNSLENWNDFIHNPAESLFSFSGLTFYGGLICAALAIWYYAKKKKIGFWQLNDAAAPALMLAYALGRIGCQVSGDGDWGIVNSAYHVTGDQKVALSNDSIYSITVARNIDYYISEFHSSDVPHKSVKAASFLPTWMVAYSYPHNVVGAGARIPNCNESYCSYLPLPVFPTPFYETVVCLLLFFLLLSMRKILPVPGTLFGFYLLVNGIERFFIEKIRVNTRYSIFGYHPTQAEIISSLLIVAGIGIMVILPKKAKAKKSAQV